MLAAAREGHQAPDRHIAVVPAGARRYAAACATGWNVGPAPNGGYLVSLACAALRRELARPDVLTVTSHFVRPAHEGPLELVVEPLQAGRRHSTAEVDVLQEGRLVVHVVATLGDLDAARGPSECALRWPAPPPPGECVPTDIDRPELPVLGEHLEIRLLPESATWLIAGRPSGRAEIGGWVRFRDRAPPGAGCLPLLADCFPPAVRNLAPVLWAPTVELTVHTRGRPEGEWIFARFRSDALLDGYVEETGELWDAGGHLVGMSRQLAIVRLMAARP